MQNSSNRILIPKRTFIVGILALLSVSMCSGNRGVAAGSSTLLGSDSTLFLVEVMGIYRLFSVSVCPGKWGGGGGSSTSAAALSISLTVVSVRDINSVNGDPVKSSALAEGVGNIGGRGGQRRADYC